MMDILDATYNLVRVCLIADSPILSGNMLSGIEMSSIDEHQIEICINAPFYDINEWRKTGNIVYTGLNWKGTGITDYAFWVNEIGAFGKHNKSEAWVNRSLLKAVKIIAAQYNIPEDHIIMKLRTK